LGIFIWAMVSINSILSQGKAINLYNPHTEGMSVEINGESYFLSPRVKQEVDLKMGRYEVKSRLGKEVIWDTTISITKYTKENGALINLSGQSMYLWTEYYGSPVIEEIYFNDSTGTSNSPLSQVREAGMELIVVDSTLIYGNIKEFPKTQLVINKQWYFDIDRAFQDQIETSDASAAMLGKGISKIFDKQDLLLYWEVKKKEAMEALVE